MLLSLLLLIFFACKKESFTGSSSALLQTSADTLHFDTVFTTTGSVSQAVKIINENNKGIHIASVKLAGGHASPFKINVDGLTGPEVSNVDVLANDSLYIFVTVSINPTAANLPFIVRDSIEVNYNGHKKFIQLDAYGRNAHFFRNKKITSAETWNNDLPYVILDRLTVDTNALLTINKGCRIYMHADAPFIVHGSLQVNGEKWDSTRVVFASDRLDQPYRDFPGSYPGIYFTDASRNNLISYGIIKNAYQAIVASETVPGTKLTLNETIIDNAYEAGLTGINTNINARNLLVSNCGKDLILAGGSYNFVHCTAVAFSNAFIQHKDPVLLLSNYANGNAYPLAAVFRNCIFWGEDNGIVPGEVKLLKQGAFIPNLVFDQVLWRVDATPQNSTITGAINNQDPLFDSVNTSQRHFSFRLRAASPAKDKGVNTTTAIDLDGNPRPFGLPDLGAYERQQ